MQLQIVSRVISIVLISFALGALGFAFEVQEAKAIESFTTLQDVVAYHQSYELGSYWLCFLVVLLMGFAYVGLEEAIAWLVRIGIGRARSRSGNWTF